jgi:hypothetical protein
MKNKTVVMHICRKRIRNHEDSLIKLGNRVLDVRKDHKILGLTQDNRISWKKHMDETIFKASKRLNILKSLAETKWGADQGTLLGVHEMMILSALEYGGDPQQRTTYCIGSFLHLCRTENILRESGFEDLIE